MGPALAFSVANVISTPSSKNIFSLPLYPEIKDKEIYLICRVLKKIISEIKN